MRIIKIIIIYFKNHRINVCKQKIIKFNIYNIIKLKNNNNYKSITIYHTLLFKYYFSEDMC